jgi:hypothetical protein
MRLSCYECMGTKLCELDNQDADLLSCPHIRNDDPKITDVIASVALTLLEGYTYASDQLRVTLR